MVQKVIKIGSSAGVTIPKKQLEELGVGIGDKVEILVRTVAQPTNKSDQAVITAARKILTDYREDFKNLAKR